MTDICPTRRALIVIDMVTAEIGRIIDESGRVKNRGNASFGIHVWKETVQ